MNIACRPEDELSPEDSLVAEKYEQQKVIGHGSFGVVYEAIHKESGETVAIKTVLQDRRYKNRELQIMQSLSHPNVVGLKEYFYHKRKSKDEVYLNVVMDFVPDTVYRAIRNHVKDNALIPIECCKAYAFQMCRALSYCRRVGICHRVIKPQNLLLNPKTHTVKLCDFGSAKKLVQGQPNVAYICSRYYRAPELIFGAADYTHDIDIWSMGCVFAEMMIGHPLFPGESGVDQLVEIIKVLGTPSREQILAMNKNYTEFKFPQVKPHPWSKVFRNKVPDEAVDFISKLLVYRPEERLRPLQALAHPFFDSLRGVNVILPNGSPLPPVFDLTPDEVKEAEQLGILDKIVPASHLQSLRNSVQ